METENRVTIDHDEIRFWAETHRGMPQIIEEGGIVALRIDFPGISDEEYDISNQTSSVSWNKFFEIFDAQRLAIEFIDNDRPPTQRIDYSEQYRFIKRDVA
jgi:hypothetical protein